jgi:hypothetical protein
MTKVDMLRRILGLIPFIHITNSHEGIYHAMDEYAKQQAIAFGFHVLGADPNDPEMGGMEAMSKTYDQFIESQKQ